MRPPKIDFRFLFYTSKNMDLKKYPFVNANLLEKYQIKINNIIKLIR